MAMNKIKKGDTVAVLSGDDKGKTGEVIAVSDKGDGYIIVACGEGALKITSLIPEGKGRMTAGDFVRGRKIALHDILE